MKRNMVVKMKLIWKRRKWRAVLNEIGWGNEVFTNVSHTWYIKWITCYVQIPLFKSFCLNTKTCSWRIGHAALFPQGMNCLLQFFKEQQRREGRKNEDGDGDGDVDGYLHKKAGKKMKIKMKMDKTYAIYIFGN